MKKNLVPILTLIVILMAFNLACLFSGIGSAPTPERTVPVSTEAAQGFVNSFEKPTFDATGNTASIKLTEEQITSYVASQLNQDPNPIIQNPQVLLEDNQVKLSGQVETDIITAPGMIIGTLSIDNNHLPKVTIISAKVGGFDIPPSLLTRIDSMIDRAITDNLTQPDVNFQVDSISINNRVMTITLKRK
jgi:hypothetical protein